MARFAVIIINYNCHRFLEPQVTRLRKYLKLNPGDSLDIIVGDNSRSPYSSSKNKEYCRSNDVIYIRCGFAEGDYSSHHALALNKVVNHYKNNFNSILLIDHDIFLYDYSDIFLRSRENDFVGRAENKIGKTYLHPGSMLLNMDQVSDNEFDFIPCEHMDTGGKLADLIERSRVEFLTVYYTYYSVEGYEDFYEVIDNSWMHFVKGSNWNRNPYHGTKVEFLLNELERISK